MSTTTAGHNDKGAGEKRNVAFRSFLAAIVLSATKLMVGLATGSLGILSEAAHSALDLVATGITLWAVRAAAVPADRDHLYGHGKFENLSSLFETLLLLGTCVWIVYESLARLFFRGHPHVEATFWAFGVMILSIVVDLSRSRALSRAAKRYASQALEADALHFSSDIWSSAVVLVGLGAVRMAEVLSIPWLVKADAVAALAVAGIVISASVRMGKKSVADLVDAVPVGVKDKIERAALVPGVVDVRQVRVRRSGPETFADVTLTVDGAAVLERAHEIADHAAASISESVAGADVVVHVEPAEETPGGPVDIVRRTVGRFGVGAHSIRVYDEAGKRTIELHLEVEQNLSLSEACRQTSAIEEALRQAVPGAIRVVTHLEPADASATRRSEALEEDRALVAKTLDELTGDLRLPAQPLDVAVYLVERQLSVSFRCPLDGGTTVHDAHVIAERAELFLRARIPRLRRVMIRLEPL
ncbi:MAG: cation diffusion facilitator family transporter [Pseudomonadota bacterium]